MEALLFMAWLQWEIPTFLGMFWGWWLWHGCLSRNIRPSNWIELPFWSSIEQHMWWVLILLHTAQSNICTTQVIEHSDNTVQQPKLVLYQVDNLFFFSWWHCARKRYSSEIQGIGSRNISTSYHNKNCTHNNTGCTTRKRESIAKCKSQLKPKWTRRKCTARSATTVSGIKINLD